MVEFDASNNEEQVRAAENNERNGKMEVPHPPLSLTGKLQTASLKQTQDLLLKLAKLAVQEGAHSQRLNLPVFGGETYIGMPDRDSAVSSIRVMQRFYSFGGDTFSAAVEYLDRFLSKVKVKRRYLSCISAACFYLAAKMNEENENLPSATELSSIHREVWKPSDLKRMEKLVLDKLDWNLYPSSSSLSFQEIMLIVLQQVDAEGIDDQFSSAVVERLELFLNYSNCCVYKCSTLALATLHQCLKVFQVSSAVTRLMMLQFQTVCQISDSELFDCQCAISQQYDLYNTHSTIHPPCLPLPRILPRPNLVIRPSFYGSTDLPTIEEVSWNEELREEEHKVIDQSTLYSEIVKRKLHDRMDHLQCHSKRQDFVGKIGVLYGDLKCNITQA